MCGICGIADFRGASVEQGEVLRMREVMESRGPDDAGLFVEPGVGLGHRRLSIIDLSAAGRQPMASHSGRYQIVFNGEIYNYQELRRQLTDSGITFRSETDTEVLLEGFVAWGLDKLVQRLRGMFAFAIWDRTARKMHLARDHFGKKPLFYAFENGRFHFASDIKAIWIADSSLLDLNPNAIDEYLYYYFITQRQTISKKIHNLQAGTTAIVDATGVATQRYWKPRYDQRAEATTMEDALVEYEELLTQSVKRRLVGDVPVGALLSGGVDSTSICTILSKLTPGVQTFSAGYSNHSELDERAYAREVAGWLDTKHLELELQPTIAEHLSELVWQYGEPFGDSSALPSYMIAELASEHVSVVMTGDGGDEGFAGYERYTAAIKADKLQRLPLGARKTAASLINRLVGMVAPGTEFEYNTQTKCEYLKGSRATHARFTSIWDALRADLYTKEFGEQLGSRHPIDAQCGLLDSLSGRTMLDQSLEYTTRQRLPSDYLRKVDVATMASSLEARSPFLDLDLFEFATKLPINQLLNSGIAKAVPKAYLARQVSSEFVYRKKAGFEMPTDHWFRYEWYEETRQLLLEGELVKRGIMRAGALETTLAAHRSGRWTIGNQIWSLLMLELWLKMFMTGSLQPGELALSPNSII